MITFHSYIHRKLYFLVLDMQLYIEFIRKCLGFLPCPYFMHLIFFEAFAPMVHMIEIFCSEHDTYF